MVHQKRSIWIWGLLAGVLLAATATAEEPSLPKVRAITAFVRLDHEHYTEQIGAALTVLRDCRDQFQNQGYVVETLRIVTQPLADLVRGQSDEEALGYLKALDDLAAKEGFMPNVGPAMLRDTDDPRTMALLTRALSTLPNIQASAIIAADDGIHWRVIAQTAHLVHEVSEHSARSQGTFNFTATAMLAPYGPFYPGAWHDGAGRQLAIGFEGANVVQQVFARTHGDFAGAVAELTRQLTVHARIAATIGSKVAAAHGWTFAGVDPTPAPLGDVSIGAAMESFTGAKFGSSGTLTAALAITTAVKAVPVRQTGYAGLMVPVMEDKVLARRWAEGSYGIDDLLAYSAVCGTGLDTVPLPGEVSEAQLQRIYGDVAALAFKWHKPLSARLQPVQGKQAGAQTDFSSPALFNTTLHALP